MPNPSRQRQTHEGNPNHDISRRPGLLQQHSSYAPSPGSYSQGPRDWTQRPQEISFDGEDQLTRPSAISSQSRTSRPRARGRAFPGPRVAPWDRTMTHYSPVENSPGTRQVEQPVQIPRQPKPGPIYMASEKQQERDFASVMLGSWERLAEWAFRAGQTVPAARLHFERLLIGSPVRSEEEVWPEETGVEWEDRGNQSKQRQKDGGIGGVGSSGKTGNSPKSGGRSTVIKGNESTGSLKGGNKRK